MSELDTHEFFEELDQQDLDDHLQSMEDEKLTQVAEDFWENRA